MYYPKELLPNKTQRKKAIALAKDVLLQILPNKYFEAKKGVYLNFKDQYNNYYDGGRICKEALRTDSVKVVLKTFLNKDAEIPKAVSKVKCEVCAIGSMLAAEVIKNNKLSITSIQRGADDAVDTFRRKIGYLNSDLMEHAFEGWERILLVTECDTEYTLLYRAGKHFTNFEVTSAKKRLRLICENIVLNNGVFVPKGVKLRSEHKNI